MTDHLRVAQTHVKRSQMPTNKKAWNLKDINKNDFFTDNVSKDLLNKLSDRQISSFYVQNAVRKTIAYNNMIKTYDKDFPQL